MRGVRRGAIVIAAATVLVACGGGDPAGAPASPTGSTPTERPSSTATLTIEAPANGEVVALGPVELVVGLKGGELVDTTSTDLRPDQGHLHVTVDDELISMTSGLRQTLPDLTPGSHLIKVEFVANDHGFFEPRVLTATTFEVRG
jgi:hypothetical protein